MMKFLVVVLAFVAVASAQYLAGGYHHGSAPSIHSPFASSVNTGIRRYGSTAGFVAPAYAHAAIPAYGGHFGGYYGDAAYGYL